MPATETTTFGEFEEFQAALRVEGFLNLTLTTPGRFRARLARVALKEIRLLRVDERIARIGIRAIPANTVAVAFPIGNAAAPVYGGLKLEANQLIMLPAGEPFHTRTNGSVLWGAIWLPVGRLLEIAASLTGFPLSLPLSPALYKAPATTYRDLRALHGAAFRIAADSPQVLADPEAVHGLEQQIFEAVITSLSEMVENRQTQRMRQNQAIMIAFEHLVQSGPATKISLTEIGRTLRVSEARLRRLGADYLGMSPIAYERLSRLSRARSALLNVNAAQGSAFAMAGDYGFDNVIAFESHYRALFGESPYATLHRRRGI